MPTGIDRKNWVLKKDISKLPQYKADTVLENALYNMTLEESILAIEPDSTLADKDLVVFDTVAVDSDAAKKAEKEEKKEAEKIYNSIRRKTEPKEESQNTESNSDNQESGTSSSSEGQAPATPEVVAPTPKVESIETE
jgi:hypothetical protein